MTFILPAGGDFLVARVVLTSVSWYGYHSLEVMVSQWLGAMIVVTAVNTLTTTNTESPLASPVTPSLH